MSVVPRTPETNLLYSSLPDGLTNKEERPNSHAKMSQFGADQPLQIKRRQKMQKQAWGEIKSGCPAFTRASNRQAMDVLMGRGQKVVQNMGALFG